MSPVREHATRRKAMRVATVLTGMTGLVGGFAVAANPAYAGTNGQELEVCGIPKDWDLYISGYNQRNSYVIYGPVAVTKAGCATTTGWWWKGPAFVEIYQPFGSYEYKSISVPTHYPTNVYKVTF